jgi:hypothetical protein
VAFKSGEVSSRLGCARMDATDIACLVAHLVPSGPPSAMYFA